MTISTINLINGSIVIGNWINEEDEDGFFSIEFPLKLVQLSTKDDTESFALVQYNPMVAFPIIDINPNAVISISPLADRFEENYIYTLVKYEISNIIEAARYAGNHDAKKIYTDVTNLRMHVEETFNIKLDDELFDFDFSDIEGISEQVVH